MGGAASAAAAEFLRLRLRRLKAAEGTGGGTESFTGHGGALS